MSKKRLLMLKHYSLIFNELNPLGINEQIQFRHNTAHTNN